MKTEIEKKIISLADVGNVIDALNLWNKVDCLLLADWQKVEGTINLAYQNVLEIARQKLRLNRSKWNEEELKMKFISVVMEASEIEMPDKIQVFYERPLAGTIQNYEFSVICDCMIATPTQGGKPKAPYFFLQEFKKEKGDKIDPEAQMLVAMLLAQQENAMQNPVYGAWVQGENWYFAILNDKEYCRSDVYIATETEDLKKIIYMLQYLKTVVTI